MELDRSSSGPSVRKASTTEDIGGVFLLRNKIPTLSISHLKPQKVAKVSQILHLKLLLEMPLQRKNGINIITENHHVIYIKQKEGDAARRPASKESIV